MSFSPKPNVTLLPCYLVKKTPAWKPAVCLMCLSLWTGRTWEMACFRATRLPPGNPLPSSSFEQTGNTEDASKKDISVQVIQGRGVSGSHKSMAYKWKILIQPPFGTRWLPKLTVSAWLTWDCITLMREMIKHPYHLLQPYFLRQSTFHPWKRGQKWCFHWSFSSCFTLLLCDYCLWRNLNKTKKFPRPWSQSEGNSDPDMVQWKYHFPSHRCFLLSLCLARWEGHDEWVRQTGYGVELPALGTGIPIPLLRE